MKQMEPANRIREIRMNMGLSQENFAEVLDISLSAYKKIEGGDNGISVNVLTRLRDKIQISSDYILYGENKCLDDTLFEIKNLSEEDKMKIFLFLYEYFVDSKKKTFTEKK